MLCNVSPSSICPRVFGPRHPRCAVVKNLICQCRRYRRHGFDLLVGKSPWSWSRKWQPTPVFLPRKFCEQWNLAGYSPVGCKESDRQRTTEHACMHTLCRGCCGNQGRKGHIPCLVRVGCREGRISKHEERRMRGSGSAGSQSKLMPERNLGGRFPFHWASSLKYFFLLFIIFERYFNLL